MLANTVRSLGLLLDIVGVVLLWKYGLPWNHVATELSPDMPAQENQAHLAYLGPVLIEAMVDPHESPLPPKITLEQARHFAQALARGTPSREKIALTVLSDRCASFCRPSR